MELDRQRLNYALLLIVGCGLVSTARAMTLSFLAIKLHQSFGLGPAAIGILLGLGPLIGAVAAPFAGALSDRAGRKTVMTVTLVSTALALIGMGIAETVLAFCLAQIVSAVAVAIYEPISRAMMSDVCPERLRLRYFSWRYTVSNAGWAIGPLIGVAAGTASTVLFIAAGAIYAVFALVLHLLPAPVRTEAQDHHAPVAAGLVQSMKAAIRDPRLAFFIAGGSLSVAVYGQWSATLSPYLADRIEGGVDIFAYLLSINGAVVLAGNLLARRFIEHTGALNAMLAGCLLLVVSEIGFLSSSGFWGLALTMVVFTLGEILIVPSEYLLVDGISNDRNRGSYFGAHSFSSIGNFIGPTLGGIMLGMFGGPGMFLMFAGFAAASAVLFTIGTRMPPPEAKTPLPSAGGLGHAANLHLRGSFA